MKKIKTYVLTISEFFPKTHDKAGLPTGFINSIGNKTKKHTIRGNYPLWKKRIDEVLKGNAVLSIRHWTGKPYNSKQKEVYVLDHNSGIGIESLQMTPLGWFVNGTDTDFTSKDFAANDGLSPIDFSEWFKGKIAIDMEPMAIIHFTEMRYNNNKH